MNHKLSVPRREPQHFRRKLASAPDFEFPEYALEVVFHSHLADEQAFGDLAIRVALDDERCNLLFPIAERETIQSSAHFMFRRMLFQYDESASLLPADRHSAHPVDAGPVSEKGSF